MCTWHVGPTHGPVVVVFIVSVHCRCLHCRCLCCHFPRRCCLGCNFVVIFLVVNLLAVVIITYYTYYYDDEADDFEANISKNYLSFVLTTQACADNAQA